MSMDLQVNPLNELLFVSFNQDYTCFACGTEAGFRVYSTDPFRLTWSRDFSPNGGLGVVAMLFRTNILAFAGGGKSPKYESNKVVLWDDRQARTIAELSFRSTVRAVRLRRDLVVVVVDKKVYVYGFRSLSLLDSIETIENKKGLCCLSVGSERTVLICPGMQLGRALVIFYPRAFGELQAPAERERTTIVAAHESSIAAMGIDYNGTLLATASDKGTIVRVYDTSSGSRRQELRRGADRAEIHSLVFSPSGEFLAVSSDKGTIHVFAVGRHLGGSLVGSGYPSELSAASGPAGNAKSSLSRMSRVLPAYFSSEWSLAQFRVPDTRCIAAFGFDPHTIITVCANGSYYKARFDPVRGGEMERVEFKQFDEASEAAAADPAIAPPAAVSSAAASLPRVSPSAGSEGPSAASVTIMVPAPSLSAVEEAAVTALAASPSGDEEAAAVASTTSLSGIHEAPGAASVALPAAADQALAEASVESPGGDSASAVAMPASSEGEASAAQEPHVAAAAVGALPLPPAAPGPAAAPAADSPGTEPPSAECGSDEGGDGASSEGLAAVK